MELSEVSVFVERCIHDTPAPCSCVCPFGLDLRSFLKKAAKGRLTAAYRELRTAATFPTLAAAFCPRPCRDKCQRALIGDAPLEQGLLEQAVLRLAGHQPPDVFQIPQKQARVAVVGAGPAGLALALNMAQKKYPVTVFDAQSGWGGHLRSHPNFSVFEEDFSNQFSAETVDFRFHTRVSSLEELADFAAVYIATGEGGEDFGLLSSWDPILMTSSRGTVFLGGGLCGMPLMESIAAGTSLARLMEGAIQTGRAQGSPRPHRCHSHRLIPPDAPSAPPVLPSDPETGYTKEEVKAEASRCFQCVCDRCLKGCELLDHYHKAPQQISMEILADSGPHFLAGRTMTRETYSCNQCGWCASACPEGVDLGALFQFSRTARAAEGIQPAALHDFWLRELDFVSHEAFLAAPPRGKSRCQYAFFPGCQLTASLPEQTLAAWRFLQAHYDAGVVLGCCGAPAWWAGEQSLWEENTRQLRQAWTDLGQPIMVLACSTCSDLFRRFLPEIQTISLYELLEQEVPVSTQLFPQAAVFDPCSARQDDKTKRSVRSLARRAGTALEELPEPGRCCGWGGHMRTANPQLYETITEHRAQESSLPYLVYCANCREVFRERGKSCRHILEGIFGCCDRTYYLHEKRANRLQVKGEMMQDMLQQEFIPTSHPWDSLSISVGDEVRQAMEAHLISDDEVKECIWTAKQQGEGFTDGTGIYLASLQKRVMTYWVEYREVDCRYEILSAYCHRMRFGEGEQS